MNRNISDKDKKDWEKFLSNDERISDKESKVENKILNKIRSIDLHGFTLEEANKYVDDFIRKSYQEKINKLIVVTGKGLHSQNEKDPFVSKDFGILKYSVPDYIKNNPDLMKNIIDFKEADVKDGGTGAFYIYLKKQK